MPNDKPRRHQRPGRRRKVCSYCMDLKDRNNTAKKITIDYKNADALRKYISDRGKILPRRVTGTCSKHQRLVTIAIKRARHMALLPFSRD